MTETTLIFCTYMTLDYFGKNHGKKRFVGILSCWENTKFAKNIVYNLEIHASIRYGK